MLSFRRFLAGCGLVSALGVAALAQEPQLDPPPPPLAFAFSINPTNRAVLITGTTNTISITVSNYTAITNIVITGRHGTNVVEFNDAGTPPDNTAADGVFRGLLIAPEVLERTPLLFTLLLIGVDIASVTNEPPVDPPIGVTNRFEVNYTIVPRPRLLVRTPRKESGAISFSSLSRVSSTLANRLPSASPSTARHVSPPIPRPLWARGE